MVSWRWACQRDTYIRNLRHLVTRLQCLIVVKTTGGEPNMWRRSTNGVSRLTSRLTSADCTSRLATISMMCCLSQLTKANNSLPARIWAHSSTTSQWSLPTVLCPLWKMRTANRGTWVRPPSLSTQLPQPKQYFCPHTADPSRALKVWISDCPLETLFQREIHCPLSCAVTQKSAKEIK